MDPLWTLFQTCTMSCFTVAHGALVCWHGLSPECQTLWLKGSKPQKLFALKFLPRGAVSQCPRHFCIKRERLQQLLIKISKKTTHIAGNPGVGSCTRGIPKHADWVPWRFFLYWLRPLILCANISLWHSMIKLRCPLTWLADYACTHSRILFISWAKELEFAQKIAFLSTVLADGPAPEQPWTLSRLFIGRIFLPFRWIYIFLAFGPT